MSQNGDTQPDHIEAMFVQMASALTSDEGTVTLHGIGPATLFFADRPDRVVGHVGTPKFVSQWGEGENSFADDPPNAVFTFIEAGDVVPEEATVVLREPREAGDALTYSIELLEGSLPAKAGACSLFIDPVGRPLSPVSVMGVRRRQRRRGGRLRPAVHRTTGEREGGYGASHAEPCKERDEMA